MNYYKGLDKKEKISVKQKFFASYESKIYKKANTIIFFSIIGLIISIGSLVFDYVYKIGTVNYILDGLLFIFCLVFLIKMNSIKNTQINKFALENKTNDKKKSKTKAKKKDTK